MRASPGDILPLPVGNSNCKTYKVQTEEEVISEDLE